MSVAQGLQGLQIRRVSLGQKVIGLFDQASFDHEETPLVDPMIKRLTVDLQTNFESLEDGFPETMTLNQGGKRLFRELNDFKSAKNSHFVMSMDLLSRHRIQFFQRPIQRLEPLLFRPITQLFPSTFIR